MDMYIYTLYERRENGFSVFICRIGAPYGIAKTAADCPTSYLLAAKSIVLLGEFLLLLNTR